RTRPGRHRAASATDGSRPRRGAGLMRAVAAAIAPSTWHARLVRFGPNRAGWLLERAIGDELASRAVGRPVRAGVAGGTAADPAGGAAAGDPRPLGGPIGDAVADADGVFALLHFGTTPLAWRVRQALARMERDGVLHHAQLSMVAQVRSEAAR